jgi:uncharacterized protein
VRLDLGRLWAEELPQRVRAATRFSSGSGMKTIGDIVQFIERQPDMMRRLDVTESLALPDCWIGAGFVRNAVWDAMHGRIPAPSNDIDVVYFDLRNASAARDVAIEATLNEAHPQAQWDVKNQARMHQRNGVAPYLNIEDAIARWPETATAVAVRRRSGRTELVAPHGIGDLVAIIARPTPAFVARGDIVARRIRDKGWQSRWPKLRVLAG